MALAGMFFGETAIRAVSFSVLRPLVSASIEAVDFDFARRLGGIGIAHLRPDRLAELVREHEGGFVLAIEIPAEL